MLLHLVTAEAWAAAPDRPYEAPSLAMEGFIHCSPSEEVLLAVANLLYRDEQGELVVVELDEARVGSEVRWEGPAGPAPTGQEHQLFPHVYGPIDRAAVLAVRPVRRADDGTFTALG